MELDSDTYGSSSFVTVGISAEGVDPSIICAFPCETGVCGVHRIGPDGQAIRQTSHPHRSGLDRRFAQRHFAAITLGSFMFDTVHDLHEFTVHFFLLPRLTDR